MSIDLLTNPWVEQEPCREEDPRFRAGKQTLLCRSFPQLPRRRPSRGEVNSSKYLAAEEAILHAEGATQSSSVQWDDVWIEDIRACLSNEPDPAWSIWPAWKELVASAQPLHDTLRAIEISEFVSQSHEAGRPPPPETRIASAVPRSARTARLSRPPLWPTERMTPPVRAPLKHALCVANRPNVAVQAKPPLPWARKHFATSGGPKVTAGHQRRGDARRYAPARARGLANLNSLLRPVTPPPKPPQGAQAWASMRPTMPRPATPRECRTPSQA